MIKTLISSLGKIVPEEELQAKVLWRSIGVMTWVSFMFSGIASMIFFATFDPISLGKLATFFINWSAQAMYTAGFLLFWLFGFSTTLGSVILLALPLSKRQRSLPE
tara:strand:- start:217 stop:534 length:318 start_codon:yes stop_codon:yes gene_type:complete